MRVYMSPLQSLRLESQICILEYIVFGPKNGPYIYLKIKTAFQNKPGQNGEVNSLKYGYSVVQIRNTMHYGIDSSNLYI